MGDNAAGAPGGDHTARGGERGPVAPAPERRRLRVRLQAVEGHHEGDRWVPAPQRPNHFPFLSQAGSVSLSDCARRNSGGRISSDVCARVVGGIELIGALARSLFYVDGDS